MSILKTGAKAAADYYDNPVTAEFYQRLWGGADIHIGLYETGDETVGEASRAMTSHLLGLAEVTAGQKVLDIACGYGGTVRVLAEMGCDVAGIDISQTCVTNAQAANVAAGFGRIPVSLGDFHAIDSKTAEWDVVICQEAIIHSSNRPKVFSEAYRVLRGGGVFAFSDILCTPGGDLRKAKAAFARLKADAGATVEDYERMARAAGFAIEHVEQRPHDIVTHYNKLATALGSVRHASESLAAALQSSISQWQDALAGGDITWACFVARKPMSIQE